MKVLHVTESLNLSSIHRYGLLPRLPYLEHHRTFFNNIPVIYTIPYSEKQEKYIKDFVYFQLWGKPRNLYLSDVYKREQEFWPETIEDLQGIRNKEIEKKEFSVLDITIRDRDLLKDVIHIQDKSMNMFVDISEKYSHNDKLMYILKNRIPRENISIISTCTPIIRNNTIEQIKIRKK